MKRLLLFLLCVVLCLVCSSCGISIDGYQEDSNTNASSTILLFDQENVKISFCGISPDVGVGEGIYLLIENLRSESIIVNIAEVSLNDVMQAVIQPQMPLHLTSPGK